MSTSSIFIWAGKYYFCLYVEQEKKVKKKKKKIENKIFD